MVSRTGPGWQQLDLQMDSAYANPRIHTPATLTSSCVLATELHMHVPDNSAKEVVRFDSFDGKAPNVS